MTQARLCMIAYETIQSVGQGSCTGEKEMETKVSEFVYFDVEFLKKAEKSAVFRLIIVAVHFIYFESLTIYHVSKHS